MMKKILIVDDDEYIRGDLIDILGFEGYEAFGAKDGQEGILLAHEYSPDLIICDLTMPVMNGFEMIEVLRQQPATANIPVILLSARSEQTIIQNGLQVGAQAFLAKPYAPQDLLAAIQTHIM